MRNLFSVIVVSGLLSLSACAHAVQAPVISSRPAHAGELTAGASLTVVTFFSSTCPCQSAHDERLRTWHATYAPRGVRFVAIDSEAGASQAHAEAEAKKRQYPFAILPDPSGRYADALGARFATYTVILDADGRIRYAGGLDSDRTHLTTDARLWVPDALDRLLAGEEPKETTTKAFGCAIHRG